MQKSIKNKIKNFLIVTLSVLMMMPNTVAAFAKEGTDEKKIEKLELSTTYDAYDIVATTEKDSLPEGAKLHITEVVKEYQDLSDVYLTEEKGYETAKKQYFNVSFEDGEWKHTVAISPKSEVKKIPNEKPVVPPSEKPKEKPKADTGISTNSSILMLLAVLLTASAGACMISQKEEETC